MIISSLCSLGVHLPAQRRGGRAGKPRQRPDLQISCRHDHCRRDRRHLRALPRAPYGHRRTQGAGDAARGSVQPHSGAVVLLLRHPLRRQDSGARHQRRELAQRPVHQRHCERAGGLSDAGHSSDHHAGGQLAADAGQHVHHAASDADSVPPEARHAQALAARASEDLEHERLSARIPFRHARDRGVCARGRKP